MSDAFDRAANAQPRSQVSTVFGQVHLDIWDCVLAKGQGKVPFDPNAHNPDDLRTAIQLAVSPLPGSPMKQDVTRDLIAESNEWAKVVLPSIKAAGRDLRAIHQKWTQAELVPTGRRYKNAAGEEKDATTFKFVRFFDAENEAMAAADAFFQGRRGGQPAAAPAAPTAAAAPTGTEDGKRKTALRFVPNLWKQAGGNLEAFEALLKKSPLTAVLNVEDADVLALLTPVDSAA